MDGEVAWILMASVMIVMVSCHQVCFIGSEYNPQSGIRPRWFLPYKDPCECTAIRLGGMHIPASSYRQGAPYYLDELFLSDDAEDIQVYFECIRMTTILTATAKCPRPMPLGMRDNTVIPNDRIRASSSDACCPAWRARLNEHDYAWRPTSDDANPWIEVDLVDDTVVTGVITQGHYYTNVKKYKVAYQKQPSPVYEHVKDGIGNIEVFIGYTDVNTPVPNQFHESVVATVVRIEPTEWGMDGIGLRFELLGCRLV